MRVLLVSIAGLFVCAAPSAACSVDDSYKTPTNFELVQKAKVIVLARVKDVPPSWQAGEDRTQPGPVTIEPIRFIKGSAAAGDLALIGWQAPKNWGGLPTATTLAQSHFSAGLGACIRQFYTPGELVVAMFEDDPKMAEYTGRKLNQIASPWARAVETVDGPDDVWVHAAEKFVALQAGSPTLVDERIRVEIDALSKQDTVEAQAISAELQYHLSRTDPKGVWTNLTLPTATIANVHGQQGAALHCVAGTPPTVLIEGASASVEILAGKTAFATTPARPTPVEAAMLKARPIGSEPNAPLFALALYRIAEPAKFMSLVRSSSGDVQVKKDGSAVVNGRPLDALLRWASQCEKLQSLPAPTEEELRSPRS